MLFRFTIHAALSAVVVAATAAVSAKVEGENSKEHDGGSMTAVSFVAKYDPNADVNVGVDSEDVVQLLRPLFHEKSSSAPEKQQIPIKTRRNSFSLGRKDGPSGNKKDPSAEPITKDSDDGTIAAARNPFIPQKLTTMYDPTNNQEEDAVQLLRSTFHEVPLASKNRRMPTKPLRNPSFLPGTKDDPTVGAMDDSRRMEFDASAELGILDSARILSEQVIGTRELVGACDGKHPVVSPDVNLRAIVRRCLYYIDNCPYNVTLGLDCWDTSQVTDMSYAFYEARSFNQPLNSWQTSAVTNMRDMFGFAESFNQPLDSWDTSAVTRASDMFWGAQSFNQPVDSWDTSAVLYMDYMFLDARSFNQPVNSWETSSAKNMRGMFAFAESFNQPVNSWEPLLVTDMSAMFMDAKSFNQQVDSWETSAVTDMSYMFNRAESFNQCLSTWAYKNPTTIAGPNIFKGTDCPDQGIPNSIVGPWCQGAYDQCYPYNPPSSGNSLSTGRLASAALLGILIPNVSMLFF
jgi:surface protein